MNLLKVCGPQVRLCLFTFRPIALKQLNSLPTILTLSWLGGAEVMLWVREIMGLIPGSGRVYYVWFVLLLCFNCFVLTYRKISDLLKGYKDTYLAPVGITPVFFLKFYLYAQFAYTIFHSKTIF